MKGRMQRNLVLLFVCSSAIPLVLVASVGYYSSRQSITSMIRRQTMFSCVEIEERFARQLRRTQDLFLIFAGGGGGLPQSWKTRVRRTGDRVEFYTEDLRSPVGLERMFAGFTFVDTSGRPAHKIDFQADPVGRLYHVQNDDFSAGDSRGYEAAAGLGPSGLRLLQPDADSGTMLLRLVTPLFSGGRQAGAMIGDVDAGALLESIIADMSLGKNAFYFLIDSRNQVLLYHPDYSKRNQLLSIAMPSVAERLARLADDGSQRYRDAAGQEWLISYRRIAGTPWVCAVAGPLGTFLAPIRRVGLLGLGLVVAVLSLTALAIVLATRRFRGSLASLTDAADAFSSGELDRRVDVRSDDEMGALGKTFNRMASQLEQQIHERELSAKFESFYRLSSAVAHDLKGSLFSLSLLVENIDRHRHDPEFQRDSARTLQGVVEKMKKTAEKLSRRPSEAKPQMTAVRLEPLLRSVLTDSAIDRAGVRVERIWIRS